MPITVITSHPSEKGKGENNEIPSGPLCPVRATARGPPWRPARALGPLLAGAQLCSLISELRSHKLCGRTKGAKKKKKPVIGYKANACCTGIFTLRRGCSYFRGISIVLKIQLICNINEWSSKTYCSKKQTKKPPNQKTENKKKWLGSMFLKVQS